MRGSLSLLSAAVVFACAGVCLYRAREFASAAPREGTASAQVVSIDYNLFRGLRFNSYSCDYAFRVNGSVYLGHSDCPQGIADDAKKREHWGSVLVLSEMDTAAYYDPADPSINSLLDLKAESAVSYQAATPWLTLGALIAFFFLVGELLASDEKRGKGPIAVDTKGTVIYPEEFEVGSGFAGSADRETASGPPSVALRALYLEVVNKIHPDRAANAADLELRERLMKEANAAFERGDALVLRRILADYEDAIATS